jgi:hypothetical protein
MTTGNDLIKGALKEIGVLAAGEDPSSEEGQDALTILNEMIAGWEMEGIAIGASTWTLATTIPLPANHIGAIRYNLAVRLAPSYGSQVSNLTVQMADDGYRNLQTAYGEPVDMSVDTVIQGRA